MMCVVHRLACWLYAVLSEVVSAGVYKALQVEEGCDESPIRSAQFSAGIGRQKRLAGLVGADAAPVCEGALFALSAGGTVGLACL